MPVLLCQDINLDDLSQLLNRYGIKIKPVADNSVIPGSWFGDSEAGLVDNELHVRSDTPVHSALHEACHYICMDDHRRQQLHTNAGGDYNEENGVCYLQILLANFLPDFSSERMFQDMDEWGYSFRLGSAQTWFEQDAEDAQAWLIGHGLIDEHNQPLWCLRR
ncbi:MAG: hypothetical protein ACN4GM_12200 [Gammaproteobacteria bacterium]